MLRTEIGNQTHRYRLSIDYDRETGPAVALIMCNPSSANITKDDPTTRAISRIADDLGWRRVIIGNIFASRTANPHMLMTLEKPERDVVNETHLQRMMGEADQIVVAWGSKNKIPHILQKRWQDVVRIADSLDMSLWCIKTCEDGHPTHPLWAGVVRELKPWDVPWFPNRESKT